MSLKLHVRVSKCALDRSMFMSSSDDEPGEGVQDIDLAAIEEEDEAAFSAANDYCGCMDAVATL